MQNLENKVPGQNSKDENFGDKHGWTNLDPLRYDLYIRKKMEKS